jgi:hypothetical protein
MFSLLLLRRDKIAEREPRTAAFVLFALPLLREPCAKRKGSELLRLETEGVPNAQVRKASLLLQPLALLFHV